jgi:DoxX-like family
VEENKRKQLPRFYLNAAIAVVWLVNGLFCKLLNLVPRHQEIVARILGDEHSFLLTKTIGIMEIFMAVWVFSRKNFRLAAIVQAVLVGAMNIIEFLLAPDLLLFGRINILFAAAFIVLVLVNGKVYQKTIA